MSMQMRQLLGNPDSLTSEKRSPFELKVVDFLDAVSADIMKNPQSQAVPGLRAFGFWCRFFISVLPIFRGYLPGPWPSDFLWAIAILYVFPMERKIWIR